MRRFSVILGMAILAVLLLGMGLARSQPTGSIVAWGYNGQGQCDVPAPNADFVAVAGGWYHSLALKASSEMFVLSPNGRENWIDSCSYPITWSSTGSGIDHIRLLYSTDGGATYPDTIHPSTPNTGSYTWTVPSIISSTVRVKAQAEDASDSVLAWDESDTNFTITLKGDVNSDCRINILDIIRMVNIILGNPPPPTDMSYGLGMSTAMAMSTS